MNKKKVLGLSWSGTQSKEQFGTRFRYSQMDALVLFSKIIPINALRTHGYSIPNCAMASLM